MNREIRADAYGWFTRPELISPCEPVNATEISAQYMQKNSLAVFSCFSKQTSFLESVMTETNASANSNTKIDNFICGVVEGERNLHFYLSEY